jgi:hypothetical protein
MLIRGQFSDFFMSTMLPALNRVIWKRYNQRPDEYSRIYDVNPSGRSIEQFGEITGLGLFSQVTEGAPVRYDQPMQGFHSTFAHLRFGLGFMSSQDLVEDDKIALIKKMGIELGRSCKESVEIDAASHFNNGFSGSYLGPDGKSLFASDHPLIKAGGTQSNLLSVAADLDVTPLELALTDWENMKDSSGKKLRLPSPKLVIPPAYRWHAHEILKGRDWRSDTANHTINAFQFGDSGPIEDVFVWHYLTTTVGWFLVAPPTETGLVFFWRRKPYTDYGYDFDTESGKTAMRYRKSHGWTDFYGTYGTPGV